MFWSLAFGWPRIAPEQRNPDSNSNLTKFYCWFYLSPSAFSAWCWCWCCWWRVCVGWAMHDVWFDQRFHRARGYPHPNVSSSSDNSIKWFSSTVLSLSSSRTFVFLNFILISCVCVFSTLFFLSIRSTGHFRPVACHRWHGVVKTITKSSWRITSAPSN